MIPRRWLIFFSVFICIPAILYFVPRWIVDTWSYARWDNFECNLPTLAKAHSTLLQGVLPRINFSEHLGEPLPASIQTGIFYFPYTIAVAFIKSAHLPWNELGAIVYAMHMAWAFIGTVLFLRELRVRSSLAVSFAALACCGGWIQMLSGIWVFVMPCFSWLPWMLLGTLWITQGRRPVAGGWLIAIGTASLGCIGYPQIGAYCGLFFLIVSVIGILVVTRDVRKLQAMAFSTLAGVLLSLPAILPFLFQLPETVRGQRIPESSFMEASVAGRSLVGLFTPLVRVDNGFLIQDTSIPLFQGVMVPFFLMIALARLLMKRRKLQASEINLTRWTSVLIGISALFLILALGASTPVYRWTYWIPIWSSFRWPHKILSVVQWGLPVSAALSAEIYCRSPVTKVRLGFFISTLIAGLFLGTTLAWPAELANRPLGYAVLGVSLVSLGLAPWISHRLPRYAFVVLSLASAVLTSSLVHERNLKNYPYRLGESLIGALQIPPGTRVLPLSHVSSPGVDPQLFANFAAGDLSNYWSLTGCTHPTVPLRFVNALPSDVWGVLPESLSMDLIPSNFLKSLGVRYFVVSDQSPGLVSQVERQPGARLVRRLGLETSILENPGAITGPYFAKRLEVFSSSSFELGMIRNQASVETAYVLGLNQPRNPSEGMVLKTEWENRGAVDIAVAASADSFLVIPVLFSGGWKAWVDDQLVPIQIVNKVAMGISLPRSARHIRFQYEVPGLSLGILGAILGLAILIAWTVGARRTKLSGFKEKAPGWTFPGPSQS